mmetsp:Transcript_29872/g.44153  ORF Transcript_29872/g.44153 Transcript_29872/m.44153 type:complete len:498 (+) Transcript_29872:107-1600(+)
MKLLNNLAVLALSTVASAKHSSYRGRRAQTVNEDSYAGKKGYGYGYGYGGKKGGYDYDECPTGKKGGYTFGKKGGTEGKGGKGNWDIEIPDYGDSCVICDKQNKNKPVAMVLQYVADGANSAFQPSGKATCREQQYPSPALITVNGDTYDVVDGDLIEIFPGGDAETDFHIVPTGQAVFDEDVECYIHTSCSVPIVVGDQIGPFLIMGNEDCEAPEEPECPPCQVCDTGRPDSLTLKYHSEGKDSMYQPEDKASCRTDIYPNSASVTVEGATFNLDDGDIFTITPEYSSFSAETDFEFIGASNLDCFIHTSCSVPLVPGDQIGPFEVIGDEDCPQPKCINAVVGTNDEGETAITVEFSYSNLPEDRKWAQNCDARDENCPGFDLAPLKNDWIGFYPCDEKAKPIPYPVEPEFWSYTCYDQNCHRVPDSGPVSEATVVFEDQTLPLYGRQGIHTTIAELEAAGGGCMVVLLNKYTGYSPAPYYNICEGNEIMLPDKSG